MMFPAFVPALAGEATAERYGDDLGGEKFESREHLICDWCGEDLGPIYRRTTREYGHTSSEWTAEQLERYRLKCAHGCIYWSFKAAQKFLERARDPQLGKPIAANTRLFLRHGTDTPYSNDAPHIAIQFHATDIIALFENGTTRFTTGGWRRNGSESNPTPTTLDRLRHNKLYDFFSHRIGKENIACVRRTGEDKPAYIFDDGIHFGPRGRCLNGERLSARLDQHSEEKRERRKTTAQMVGLTRRTKNALRSGQLEVFSCATNATAAEGVDPYNLPTVDRGRHYREHLEDGTLCGDLVLDAARDWLRGIGEDGERDVQQVLDYRLNEKGQMVMGGSELPEVIVERVGRKMYKRLRATLLT